MARAILTAALTLAAVGFGTGSEAKAQYTVYIWNMNANNGWVRSGVAGTVFATKQACLNNIAARVAENKRFGTNWEAFAVVRSAQRPNPGFLNAQNMPGWWQGQIRFIPANAWYNVTVMKDRDPRPTAPGLNGSDTHRPLFRRETEVANV